MKLKKIYDTAKEQFEMLQIDFKEAKLGYIELQEHIKQTLDAYQVHEEEYANLAAYYINMKKEYQNTMIIYTSTSDLLNNVKLQQNESNAEYATVLSEYNELQETLKTIQIKYGIVNSKYSQAEASWNEADQKYQMAKEKLKEIEENYLDVMSLYTKLKNKHKEATDKFDVEGQPYRDALEAYEKALIAQENINTAISHMNQVIAKFPVHDITLENSDIISTLLENWKAEYDEAEQMLREVSSNSWLTIGEYQARNDAYNNSSIAPSIKLDLVYNYTDFDTQLTDYINEANEVADKNLENARSFEAYFAAYKTYHEEFDNYLKGWKPGNVGDPNNEQEKWLSIINAMMTSDFSNLGYTKEALSEMETTSEWDEIVSAYEQQGAKSVENVKKYAEYIISVSDTWTAANVVMTTAINQFEQKTQIVIPKPAANNRLGVAAKSVLYEADNIYNSSLATLKNDPYPENCEDNVYQWLIGQGFGTSLSWRISGQTTIGSVGIPIFAPKGFATGIGLLEIYQISPPKIPVLPDIPEAPEPAIDNLLVPEKVTPVLEPETTAIAPIIPSTKRIPEIEGVTLAEITTELPEIPTISVEDVQESTPVTDIDIEKDEAYGNIRPDKPVELDGIEDVKPVSPIEKPNNFEKVPTVIPPTNPELISPNTVEKVEKTVENKNKLTKPTPVDLIEKPSINEKPITPIVLTLMTNLNDSPGHPTPNIEISTTPMIVTNKTKTKLANTKLLPNTGTKSPIVLQSIGTILVCLAEVFLFLKRRKGKREK